MPLSQERRVRHPAVAGVFYPADAGECAKAADRLLRSATGSESKPQNPGCEEGNGPRHDTADAEPGWFGAIVPHAGWICSGAIAGLAIAHLARLGRSGPVVTQPDLVVVFGAIHTALPVSGAVLGTANTWAEPMGPVAVCDEVIAKLAEHAKTFVVDDRFHEHEHAIEVELPLIQSAWPGVSLLPIEMPLIDGAAEIGAQTARVIAAHGLSAVFLASSDLTHYGPVYGSAPAGIGHQGLDWAKQNDRRLLDLVLEMNADEIVPEVRRHSNACGGGAIAAMLGACREFGVIKKRSCSGTPAVLKRSQPSRLSRRTMQSATQPWWLDSGNVRRMHRCQRRFVGRGRHRPTRRRRWDRMRKNLNRHEDRHFKAFEQLDAERLIFGERAPTRSGTTFAMAACWRTWMHDSLNRLF